jgi:hypothetical protein
MIGPKVEEEMGTKATDSVVGIFRKTNGETL